MSEMGESAQEAVISQKTVDESEEPEKFESVGTKFEPPTNV
jgi:hypothetical protein